MLNPTPNGMPRDSNAWRLLAATGNDDLISFVEGAVELCRPDSVFVSTGSPEDLEYIRGEALRKGEELRLRTPGHTLHFDSPLDQARARDDTAILVGPGEELPFVRTKPREDGLREVTELLKGSMRGRQMYVGIYSLGPLGSPFSMLAVQITDSAYVMHSENILYRSAYSEAVRAGGGVRYLKFLHSQGELDEMGRSRNISKRRIYIDVEGETVYSVNTQYGGNSMGLKKLALRLTIRRAMREGWLSEHMFLAGVDGPGGRVTYFTGAFPSMSGKTSTAMLGRLLGDDLAYLRWVDGEVRAVNPEAGVFGIIEGINSADDPVIYEVLESPGEVIFSNVLMLSDGGVYWNGKDGPVPDSGINFSGEWHRGKVDQSGKPVPPSHPNARFTVPLRSFRNLDPKYDDPRGVRVDGVIFGSRDPDTAPPLLESFDWSHGVVTIAASLESERTAAVLGKSGEMEFNPMANLDFLSVPLGEYIARYLEFGRRGSPPRIFGVNYFLRGSDGRYLNSKSDKRVWLAWMELRVHDEVEPLRTPIGLLPRYEDLRRLFSSVLAAEYTREAYGEQFAVRVSKYLEKIGRIVRIYSSIGGVPREFFEIMDAQRRRLEALGPVERVSPFEFYRRGPGR
jgi:phosphoenolpyruvate carboxykinase (GTP)